MSTQFTESTKQDPIIVPPGGGDEYNIPGLHFFHKVKSIDTNGVFSVIELVAEPGMGVSLHVHEREDELVYLLEGEIEVTLGDQSMKAVKGVMALLPREIPHGFTNVGTTPARLIVTILPGPFDAYFVELADLFSDGDPDPAKLDDLSIKYGITYL